MTDLHVPLDLSELLHATLGPLAETLEQEGHHWAPMVKRVLGEYTRLRNAALRATQGRDVTAEVAHITFLASEKVCALTEKAVTEEQDFIRWAAEVDGEHA